MVDLSVNNLALGIANLGIELVCPDMNSRERLAQKFQEFLVPNTPEWHVQVFFSSITPEAAYPEGIHFHDQRLSVVEADSWGWLSAVEKKGELFLGLGASSGTVDYYLRAAFALLAFEAGGLMLHAAGVVQGDRAHCFFGHSGSGKTTVSRHSPPGSVLNDDLLLILPKSDEWIVYGTPFTNPTQVKPMNRAAKLGGLYRLIQDRSVYLESLSNTHALAELFSCLPVIPADPERGRRLLTRLQSILAKYPAKLLHFTQDSSFWGIIK